MPVSSQPNMGTDSAATTNAFSTKSAADRITSYMWYVHVLVRVNTEERLRANIAPLLEHSSTFSSSSSSSLSSSAFASPTVSEVLLSPGTNFTTQSGRASMDDQHNRRDHEMTDDLTDHLILWLFNHKILAYLVERPPVLEQAIGYTRSLSDVPEAFREEFCRRLYTLLFSKRVVEWPHGIDVPVPTVGAAQPVVVADGGEAATAAATTTTTKTPAGVVELEEVEGTHLEHPWPPPPMEEPPQNDGDNEHDDNKNHNNNSNKRSSSTRASSPVAGSRWMRTPTPSTFCYDSEMEQGGYFGTVDNPMPLNSLGNLSRSRNGYGPPPPVGIDEQGEYASCGQQPMPPFPSPQPIAITPVGFQAPAQRLDHDEPPSAPHPRRQGFMEPPSGECGYDVSRKIQHNIGCEENRRYPLGNAGGGVGRPASGRMTQEQFILSNERRVWDRDWDRGSPVAGRLEMPAHHHISSHILLPLAEQAEARQLAQGRRRWEVPEGVRVKSSQVARASGIW